MKKSPAAWWLTGEGEASGGLDERDDVGRRVGVRTGFRGGFEEEFLALHVLHARDDGTVLEQGLL